MPPANRKGGFGPGSKMAGGEKAENFSEAIKKLFAYGKAYAPGIVVAMLLAVAGAILNLIGPSKLSEITDLIGQGITSTIDVNAVVQIAVVLAILYGVAWVCNFGQGFIMATITQIITRK